MRKSTHTVEAFPRIRKATIDLLDVAGRKHMIHGLIKVDVTKPRRILREIGKKSGEAPSFTGFIIHCCAKAVDKNQKMHAYRDWRNRLIMFDEVDVSTPIERVVEGQNQVVPVIIRAANRKSIKEIHQDIRQAQSERVQKAGVFQAIKLYLMIPPIIRRFLFRVLDRTPHLMKQKVGTVMVTSVGMFGRGEAWGVPIASHSLNITIGGIETSPAITDGQIEKREYLCLTVSFDHDLIDGAPAARFIRGLKKLVESGSGL